MDILFQSKCLFPTCCSSLPSFRPHRELATPHREPPTASCSFCVPDRSMSAFVQHSAAAPSVGQAPNNHKTPPTGSLQDGTSLPWGKRTARVKLWLRDDPEDARRVSHEGRVLHHGKWRLMLSKCTGEWLRQETLPIEVYMWEICTVKVVLAVLFIMYCLHSLSEVLQNLYLTFTSFCTQFPNIVFVEKN